jgi:hypothetical protein
MDCQIKTGLTGNYYKEHAIISRQSSVPKSLLRSSSALLGPMHHLSISTSVIALYLKPVSSLLESICYREQKT